MVRRIISAVAALALAGTSVAAQAAPAPRVDSSIEESSEQLTTTHWVLIVIGVGLLIWGIIELTDDDEPESP